MFDVNICGTIRPSPGGSVGGAGVLGTVRVSWLTPSGSVWAGKQTVALRPPPPAGASSLRGKRLRESVSVILIRANQAPSEPREV